MNEKIAAVIIVFNEEIHIERCLLSLKGLVDEVHIIDSYSSDKTIKIASKYGALIYQVDWENSYSKKYNWALENICTKCDWIFRIDADEICSPELCLEIREELKKDRIKSLNSLKVKRVIKFLGKELLFGGMQPVYTLRLFKKNYGFCESKLMDEHIVVKNEASINLKHKLIDDNKKGWEDWISKHNTYALKEAIDAIQRKDKKSKDELDINSNDLDQVRKKRKHKGRYEKLPLFIRPIIYFLYRYILKGGFRDGFSGFSWHFLQGLWYRMLVDIKIYQILKDLEEDNISLQDYIYDRYGFSIKFDK